MNIAIQMEIKTRELEARTLLALVAAERGHDVLLGDIRTHLAARPEDFARCVFHDKSLTPSTSKRHFFSLLRSHGSLLTSQDEEHWLNLPSFDVPGVRRFSSDTLALAARAFAWGEHERSSLASLYPEHQERLVASGSPRVDLWRPELRGYHVARPLPDISDDQSFVLFSSNFSFVLDVNPFWVRIRDKRRHFIGPDDDFEFDRYRATADKLLVLRDFVRAIRHIATTRPDVLVVVRPHPIETEGAWEDLIGPVPNVRVTRKGSLNAWIRRASVVVQNACTSGWEATVSGTPLISFHPGGILAESPVNELGLRASDLSELDRHLDSVLAFPSDRQRAKESMSSELVAHRLAIGESLAADVVVDGWDSLPSPSPEPWDVARILRGRRIAALRRRAGAAKRTLTSGPRGRQNDVPRRDGLFQTAHKFPPLTQSEVERVVTGLRASLQRFALVEAQVIAPDLVRFRRRSR